MNTNPKYRHELKYEIGPSAYLALGQRLRLIMKQDSHTDAGGEYLVTSLYFDNCYDKALREKRHGTNEREKFRLRYYGTDPHVIHLEKKQKINSLCLKTSASLSLDRCKEILHGNWQWLLESEEPLLQELGFKMRTQLLRPRTVVRYTRRPFVYEPGNVRITFDRNISGGLSYDCFFDQSILALTSGEPSKMILEVKYDEFMPDVIRMAVQPDCTRLQAFSKYAQCRRHEF